MASDRPPPPFSRRQQQLGVVICVVWALVWGLRAVFLDNLVTSTDSLFPLTRGLFSILTDPAFAPQWIWGWLNAAPTHPPLPAVYSALFCGLAGLSYEAVQVSSVVLHGLLVVELYRLASCWTRDRQAPLIAAALVSTVPVLAAWYRVDYHESLTTLLVVATLRQATVTDLRRTGPAVKLGLLVGLGALCKLSFWVVILLPAVHFLGARVRDRATLLNALAVVATVALICGWWYFPHLPAIQKNIASSTSTDLSLITRLDYYLIRPPGNLALTLLALAGVSMIILRGGLLTGRYAAAQLLLSCLPAFAFLVSMFDPWERYIVPVLPLSCLLAAVALARGLASLPAPRRAALGLLLALAAASAVFNLQRPRESYGVAESAGIPQPDRRDFSSLARALAHARRLHLPLLMVANAPPAQVWINGQWAQLGLVPGRDIQIIGGKEARKKIAGDEQVSYIQVDGPRSLPDRTWNLGSLHRSQVVSHRWRRKLVARFDDESPFAVRLFILRGD